MRGGRPSSGLQKLPSSECPPSGRKQPHLRRRQSAPPASVLTRPSVCILLYSGVSIFCSYLACGKKGRRDILQTSYAKLVTHHSAGVITNLRNTSYATSSVTTLSDEHTWAFGLKVCFVSSDARAKYGGVQNY